MSPPNRTRDTAGELRPEIRMTDAELAASVETFTEDGPDERPEILPPKVPEASWSEPEPEPEPEPYVPAPRTPGDTRKTYAGELSEVRRAARAHQAAREKLYESMRRARAVDPPRPSIREVAAAAGLSHAHVHREVG